MRGLDSGVKPTRGILCTEKFVFNSKGAFDYGCQSGETKFFVFDILTPEGEWFPLYSEFPRLEDGFSVRQFVPQLFKGAYDPVQVSALADGPSTVSGAKHIREGIVIRPVIEREARNLGRVQLKEISNKFLEKESQE